MPDHDDQQVLQADWTLIDGAFHADIQVEIGIGGNISRVGALGLPVTKRFDGQALLPGMINAHSHAFQRGLRGRCETVDTRSENFWSWRDEMYALVEEIDADLMHELCVQCFSEMVRSGITTVGEFHYLHHAGNGARFECDEIVLSAAGQTGIRIVLLQACYMTGDIGSPLDGAQRRFASNDLDHYFKQFDVIAERLDKSRQSHGIVAHSIRAVPIDNITRLHERAKADDIPFHMHVEEQRREIERCVARLGGTPMAVLLDRLDVGPEFTAVHCTHTRADDMTRFINAGGNVCICPTTEANLGDGIAALDRIHAADGRVCLGSDSNVRIDFIEEMRWLEYAQRLKLERRGILPDNKGDVAAALWRSATINGARSLNVNAGDIAPGRCADLFTIDLTAPSLTRWKADSLLTSIVFGCDARIVKNVCVGGRWLV